MTSTNAIKTPAPTDKKLPPYNKYENLHPVHCSCGEENMLAIHFEQGSEGLPCYFLYCCECDDVGPRANNVNRAIAEWNELQNSKRGRVDTAE